MSVGPSDRPQLAHLPQRPLGPRRAKHRLRPLVATVSARKELGSDLNEAMVWGLVGRNLATSATKTPLPGLRINVDSASRTMLCGSANCIISMWDLDTQIRNANSRTVHHNQIARIQYAPVACGYKIPQDDGAPLCAIHDASSNSPPDMNPSPQARFSCGFVFDLQRSGSYFRTRGDKGRIVMILDSRLGAR